MHLGVASLLQKHPVARDGIDARSDPTLTPQMEIFMLQRSGPAGPCSVSSGRWGRDALLVTALTLALAGPAVAEPSAFRDDFTRLDQTRWYVSDGWTNGDWQACTWSSRMVTFEDDALRLSVAPTQGGASTYLCAEVQTREAYLYGTFEARIRTDSASGANAALFTYIGPAQGATHDEIDVEILTRETGEVQFNTYRDGEPAQGATVPLDMASDEAFQTYSFIWEPERIRWFVDGRLVHEATGPDLPINPQRIFLSHWISGTLVDWMGPFSDPGRPLGMWIDWVAYTPPGGDCQFEGSVLCQPSIR